MNPDVILGLLAGLVAVGYAPGAVREWRRSVSARDAASIDRRARAQAALDRIGGR